MEALTKEGILGIKDSHPERLDIPEWNGFVFLKRLSNKDRDRYETEMQLGLEKKSFEGIRAKVMVLAICDKDGNKVFSEKDVLALNEKSAAAGERILNKVLEMNNFTDKDMEELAGNLD